MATSKEFADFVLDQIRSDFEVDVRRLFDAYMIYVNRKPMLLLCDDTVFIKQYESLGGILCDCPKAPPFEGARQWYILDPENSDLLSEVIALAEPEARPAPKKKRRKKPSPAEIGVFGAELFQPKGQSKSKKIG